MSSGESIHLQCLPTIEQPRTCTYMDKSIWITVMEDPLTQSTVNDAQVAFIHASIFYKGLQLPHQFRMLAFLLANQNKYANELFKMRIQ